jgi:hypothetical protein
MATSYVLAIIKLTNMDSTTARKRYFPETGVGAAGANRACNGLSKLTAELAGGVRAGSLVAATVMSDTGVKATAAIACTRANAAGNNVVFTFGAVAITLTEAVDFLRGASDTTCGDNLAAAINAHAVLKTIMSAAAVTGTITITSKIPTSLTHDIAISTDDATAFGLTQFASGTESAAEFFLQGFQTSNTL